LFGRNEKEVEKEKNTECNFFILLFLIIISLSFLFYFACGIQMDGILIINFSLQTTRISKERERKIIKLPTK